MLPRARRLIVSRALWAALVVFCAILVARALRAPYFTAPITPGVEGQLGIRYWEVARNSFARGDGFPLWDRSLCAGWPFLGNPDTPLLTSLIAGLFRIHGDTMSRLWTVLCLANGIAGTYYWCRRVYQLDRLSSFYAGAMWVSAGFVAMQVGFRSHFLPFTMLPWVFALARLGERNGFAALGSGAVLGLALIEGGLVPVGFGLVALLLLQLPRTLAKDSGPAHVFAGLGFVLLAFVLVSGIKLFPILGELARHPRPMRETDQLTWNHVASMLVDINTAGLPGLKYHRDEYRAYVGPLAAGAAIAGAGVAIILKPRRLDVVVFLFLTLILARGVFAQWAPYALLSNVPIYGQMNVPARWIVMVHLGMALCGAFAFDAARKAVGRPWLSLIVMAVTVLAFLDPMHTTAKTLKDYPSEPALKRPDPGPLPYQLVEANESRWGELPMKNRGTPACYKLSLEYPEGSGYALGPVPQATLDAGAGSVAKIDIKQNRYEIDLDVSRAAVLHVNQTFDRDFRASVGAVQRSSRNTLDVSLPPGQHHLVLAYRPVGLVSGLIATTLGITLLAAFPWLRRRVRARLART